MVAWINCWTNSRIVCDLRRRDDHVTLLYFLWNGSQDYHLYRYIYLFLVYCTAIIMFWHFGVCSLCCCCMVYNFCIINVYKWNIKALLFIGFCVNWIKMKSSTNLMSSWYRIGLNILRHKQNGPRSVGDIFKCKSLKKFIAFCFKLEWNLYSGPKWH